MFILSLIAFGILLAYSARFFFPAGSTNIVDKLLGDKRFTLSDRDMIDDVSLSRFVGLSINVKGICLVILGIASHIESVFLYVLGGGLFVLITIIFHVYVRNYVIHGSHFRKK